jgi:hypothetical protein
MSKIDLRELALAIILYRGGTVEHKYGYVSCRDADSLGRKVCVIYGDVDFIVDDLIAEGLVAREWGGVLRLTENGKRAAQAAVRRLGRRRRDVARYAAMDADISKIIELLEKRKIVEKRGDYYKIGLF